MNGIDFIRLPYEGCLWSEIEILSPEEFLRACETEPKPCALGWAYSWSETEYGRKPFGLVFDYKIVAFNERRSGDNCPWRVLE